MDFTTVDGVLYLTPNDLAIQFYKEDLIRRYLTLLSVAATIGIWKYTKGVYTLHPDIEEKLLISNLPNPLQTSLFRRLPEWSTYIALNAPITSNSGTLYGAWLTYAYVNPWRTTVLNLNSGDIRTILSPTNTEEQIFITWDGDELIYKQTEVYLIRAKAGEFELPPYQTKEYHILNLFLYLCDKNAEFSNEKSEASPPKPTFDKKQYGVPQSTVWQVNWRLGSALRNQHQQKKHDSTPTGIKMRPHFRRAHWHTYWTGKRGEQIPEIKWIAPVLVNVTKSDDLVPVVRPAGGL